MSIPATGKITAASAINMQDVKIYVSSQTGVCLYNAKANTLTKVSDKDNDRAPNDKFGAMDTGYVSQNIYLACTALGLKTVARATMDFDTLKRELNLAETSYLELNHPIGY